MFVKVFTLLRAFLYAYGGICAAKVLHKNLLLSILKAPIAFFDVTPVSSMDTVHTPYVYLFRTCMYEMGWTDILYFNDNYCFNFHRLAESSIDFHLIWYVTVYSTVLHMYVHV